MGRDELWGEKSMENNLNNLIILNCLEKNLHASPIHQTIVDICEAFNRAWNLLNRFATGGNVAIFSN